MSDPYPPIWMPLPTGGKSTAETLDLYIAELREALKPFADLVTPALHGLPPTTKFAPKLTLEPFLAAHKALYGDDLEQP